MFSSIFIALEEDEFYSHKTRVYRHDNGSVTLIVYRHKDRSSDDGLLEIFKDSLTTFIPCEFNTMSDQFRKRTSTLRIVLDPDAGSFT